MILILLLVVMTAVVMALLLMPLLRERKSLQRSAFDLQVYEDQLRELQRDLDGRLIDDDQAEAARIEIKRRMLAASEHGHVATGASATVWRSTVMPIALAFSVPVGCSTLYLMLGAPELPSSPLAARAGPATQTATQVTSQASMPAPSAGSTFQPTAEQRAEILALPKTEQDEQINAMVDGLEQRLMTSTPDDLDGWMMLGRSRKVLGDPAAAAAAYQKALALLGSDDPRRRTIEIRLVEVGGQLPSAPLAPVDSAALSSTASSPTEGQQNAIAAGPEDPKNASVIAMVDGLTDRLKNNPDDLEGWLMLARSRTVLGEPEAAEVAYRRALSLLEPSHPRRAEIEARLEQAGGEGTAKLRSGD